MRPVFALPPDAEYRKTSALSSERKLWRAVVNCALRDAIAFKSTAIQWLLADQDDAPTVFELAEIDAAKLRPRLAKLLLEMANMMVYEGKTMRWDYRNGAGVKIINANTGASLLAEKFLTSNIGLAIRKKYGDDIERSLAN